MAQSTVRTQTILDELVEGKREELAARRAAESLASLRGRAEAAAAPLPLAPALRGDQVRLIAEIKRASPVAGVFENEFDPVPRADAYAGGGAAAISVLTEERRFLGSLQHLARVRSSLDRLGPRRPPLVRKDFLFDSYHLYEARAAGADAVLLIVAVLEQSALEALMAQAKTLGLSVLVEVHEENELDRALRAQAEIIGINNRNLRNFVTSLDVTLSLRKQIPQGPIVVSESGIQSAADIERLSAAGVDAILVGEALMRSNDLAASVREFASVQRAPSVDQRSITSI
jgi:indole-3-glycerol phosphate synthase